MGVLWFLTGFGFGVSVTPAAPITLLLEPVNGTDSLLLEGGSDLFLLEGVVATAKLSDLAEVTNVLPGDLFYVVRGGAPRKITHADLI